MKYNQPYGVSDVNAAYINGNPSTGQMGSIPPAASIEFPQREVVNLISDATLVPDNADLHQLAKAVQSGKLIYADDTGAVNIVSLNCAPPVLGLKRGMIFITKAAATNTGPATATINGITAEIIHSKDFSPLVAFDINAGQMMALAFDGLKFQLVWSASGSKASIGVLQANFDFYVNGTTGDDTLYDGTTATVVTGGHGPFKTIQKAVTAASFLNANGYTITIHVADGTYAGATVTNVTNGGLVVRGNSANPAACTVSNNAGGAIGCRGVGVNVFLDGLRITSGQGSGLISQVGAQIGFINMDFNYCLGAHISCDTGSASCYGNYIISSHCTYHCALNYAVYVLSPSQHNVVTIYGGCQIAAGGAFIYASGISYLRGGSGITTISGGMSGGYKFLGVGNSVFDTGASGVGYFPGTNPGLLYSGAQYL